MNSGQVLYWQATKLRVPVAFSLSLAVSEWFDFISYTSFTSSVLLLSFFRLAVLLSYARFGSMSAGLSASLILVHYFTLGMTSSALLSAVLAYLALLLDANNHFPWSIPTDNIGVIPAMRLQRSILVSFIAGFVPGFSVNNFILLLALEIITSFDRSFLLGMYGKEMLGSLKATDSIKLVYPEYLLKPIDHPLRAGEPLSVWLKLYLLSMSQASVSWVPTVTAAARTSQHKQAETTDYYQVLRRILVNSEVTAPAPDDLLLMAIRVNSSDKSGKTDLLKKLIASTGNGVEIAASKELQTISK